MEEANYPKVSFIIPVLNEEKTIKRCLDSIFDLDYPSDKIEILFAVGPSKDKTNDIIYDYQKKHKIHKEIHQETNSA